jgi:hypothetical protein
MSHFFVATMLQKLTNSEFAYGIAPVRRWAPDCPQNAKNVSKKPKVSAPGLLTITVP